MKMIVGALAFETNSTNIRILRFAVLNKVASHLSVLSCMGCINSWEICNYINYDSLIIP